MKIGYDAKRYFHNYTGLGNYSRNLIQWYHNLYPEDELLLFTPSVNPQFSVREKNVQSFTPLTKMKGWWRRKTICRDIKNEQCRIFHGLSNELPLGIEKTGIKSVVTIHDLLFLRFPDYYNYIDRKIYESKFKSACIRADQVIAISQATKNDLISFYNLDKDKIKVIYPTGINLQAVKTGSIARIANKPSYLLCVSSFEHRKNLLRLIKAYIDAKPAYSLIIAGKWGNTARECQTLVKQGGMQGKIELYFNVENKVISDLYANAMAFIYPSLYEGYGIPVADAVTYNLPVLTSANTSMSEITGENGYFFDASNTGSICRLLKKIDTGEGLKPVDAKNNDVLNSELQTKKLYELYNSLLHE